MNAPGLFNPAPFEAPAGSLAMPTDELMHPERTRTVPTRTADEATVRRLEAKRDRDGVDALSIVELLDLDQARQRIKANTIARLEAELALLDAFDTLRRRLGDDYGNGQRGAELGRRRSELERLGGNAYPELVDVDRAELAPAWDHVGRPRLERVLAERYRADTRPSRMTRDAWQRIARDLGKFGVIIGAAR